MWNRLEFRRRFQQGFQRVAGAGEKQEAVFVVQILIELAQVGVQTAAGEGSQITRLTRSGVMWMSSTGGRASTS